MGEISRFFAKNQKAFLWLGAGLLCAAFFEAFAGPAWILCGLTGALPSAGLLLFTAVCLPGTLLGLLAFAVRYAGASGAAGKSVPAAAGVSAAGILLFALLLGGIGEGMYILAGGKLIQAKQMTGLLSGILGILFRCGLLRLWAAVLSGRSPLERGRKGFGLRLLLFVTADAMAGQLLTVLGTGTAARSVQALFGSLCSFACIAAALYGYRKGEGTGR